MIRFYFKAKVIFVCFVLAVLFFRLSYWQYQRHQNKLIVIQQLEARLEQPARPLSSFSFDELKDPDFRKVTIEGTFDYKHEMVLRNRKSEKSAGVHVITPLKTLDGQTILVNRGFAPLRYSDAANRIKLNRPSSMRFVGLLKSSQPKKFLAPSDPPVVAGGQWVDAWLRVDIESMKAQIPTPILPFYVEIIGDPTDPNLESKIIQTKSEKAEIFMPSEQIYNLVDVQKEHAPDFYPTAAFDPVIPAGRHLGYIFEWAAMGIFTILIGIILSLRPSRKIQISSLAIIILALIIAGCSVQSNSSSKMMASYYGPGFHGKKTASGEVFNSFDYTAAHKSLPFGTIIKLTNPANNKSCVVRVNDRGPYVEGRDIDVSEQVAYELGILKHGVAQLVVEQ